MKSQTEERQNLSSGGKFEDIVGYSRAVRIGGRVYVSGTTATDDSGEIVGVDDPYAQAVQILKNIERTLRRAGAEMKDVVRTRMFVTDITRWEDFAKAHREAFGSVRPCSTMVQVSALIDPRMLIEIEAEAEL